MSAPPPAPLLIEQKKPLILVGNGAYDTAMLASFATMGPVVEVDGGYYGCRIAGITPDLLIGDMDSVDAKDLIDARHKTLNIRLNVKNHAAVNDPHIADGRENLMGLGG